MTQHFIRKNAGFGWLRRTYHRFHEPRIISAIYGTIYLLVFAVSAYSFFDPPVTITNALGNPWLFWASLGSMTSGGLGGIITVVNGRYWVERYAAGFVIGGLAIYWLVGAWLALNGGGSRLLSLLTTTLAIAAIGLRYYWINDRPYNPRHVR